MVFCILISAHLFADFLFHTSIFTERKIREWKNLILHNLLYFLILECTFFLMFDYRLAFFPAFIFSIFHFLALCLKKKLEKRFHKNRALLFFFITNQIIHIVFLFIVYYFFNLKEHFNDLYKTYQLYKNFNSIVLYILLFIILLEPTAVFIRKALALISNRKIEKLDMTELKAGNMIGKLERMIIAILLLNNQYGAIGLVLTAKSIARFKQMENRNFAEKYLVGTLTSLFIALSATIIVKKYL